MAILKWDQTGERLYETGVKKGVLYPYDSSSVSNPYPKGVAWNGLSSVQLSPSGAEATDIYADDQKYLSLYSAEEMGATVEAYTYPDEWAECDGSANAGNGLIIEQQSRLMFGLSFVTTVGNDTNGNDYGYDIHILYGCKASPSERQYQTINDSPEAISFSWTLTTTKVDGFEYTVNGTTKTSKPLASLKIRSTECSQAGLAALEAALYGTENDDAYLPLPATVYSLLNTVGPTPTTTTETFTGDGETTEFTLVDGTPTTLTSVTVNDVPKTATTDYTYNSSTYKITFTTAPAASATIKVTYASDSVG